MNKETTGVENSAGFQPINQAEGNKVPTSTTDNSGDGHDKWGFKHLPTLFQYLEGHFAFSAALSSITGYVVIAAFGQMQSVGQYLGYVIFLGVVLFVYSSDKDEKKWKYFFIITTFTLLGIVSFLLWPKVIEVYHSLNIPFSLKVSSA